MGHEEIELKRLLVGEHAAERLIPHLGQVSTDRRQVNHIFDTDDGRLRQARYALRLRFEEGAPILTAKGPERSVGTHTGARAEAAARIDEAVADLVLQGHADPVATLRRHIQDQAYTALWRGLDEAREGRRLAPVGSFENRRRTIPVTLADGLTLKVEIDETSFPGGTVEHEVEVEVPDERAVAQVEAWLDERAAAAGVATRPSSPKIARFYRALARG